MISKSKSKKSKIKELKLANRKSTLFFINKSRKISYQNKKKAYFKKKQDQKNFILAIRKNTIEDKKKKDNKK